MGFPPSISVLRGQSVRGIGEGPGRPIRSGEQYIAAEGQLDRDAGFLDAVRPWLTFDAPVGAVQATDGAAEGWAVFDAAGHRWVTRLGFVGRYTSTDQRLSYLAHARGWPLADLRFEPSTLVGRADAFLASAVEGDLVAPEIEDAAPDVEPLRADGALATSVLAHLLWGRATGRLVVLVVDDYRQFAAASPVTAAVAFARASLPSTLQFNCNVRTLTQNGAWFLSAGAQVKPASLLVLHQRDYEPVIRAAQEARRSVLLIDGRGGLVSGDPPPPLAVAYARVVLQQVLATPDRPWGLADFGAFVGLHWPERLTPEWWESRAAKELLVSLPALLSLSTARVRKGEGLAEVLLQQAGMPVHLPWPDLLATRRGPPGYLELLDRDALFHVYEAAPEKERAGGRTLREEVQAELERQNVPFDPWLRRWAAGRPAAEALGRALDLQEAGRVSDPTVVALSATVPLAEVAKLVAARTGGMLAVLRRERVAKGTLAHRDADGDALREWARARPAEVAELLALVAGAGLTGSWIEAWAAAASDAQVREHRDALTGLGAARARLLVATTAISLEKASARELEDALEATTSPREKLAIASTLHRRFSRGPARGPTMRLFADADADTVAWAVDAACRRSFPPLGPEALFNRDGLVDAVDWLVHGAAVLGRWLGAEGAREVIPLGALLALAAECPQDEPAQRALAARVDALILNQAQPVLRARLRELFDAGMFTWWTEATTAKPAQRLPIAIQAAEMWSDPAFRPRRPFTLDDWGGLLRCLGARIAGVTMGQLVNVRGGWPTLPGSEARQIADLGERCADLGAHAWLATRAGQHRVRRDAAVCWLLKDPPAEPPSLADLADVAVVAGGTDPGRAPHVDRAVAWVAQVLRDDPGGFPFAAVPGALGSRAVLGPMAEGILRLPDLRVLDAAWLRAADEAIAPDVARGAGGVNLPGLAYHWARYPRLSRLVDRGPVARDASEPQLDARGLWNSAVATLLGLPKGQRGGFGVHELVEGAKHWRQGRRPSHPLEELAPSVAAWMRTAGPAARERARAEAFAVMADERKAWLQPGVWAYSDGATPLPLALLMLALCGPDAPSAAVGRVVALASPTERVAELQDSDWWQAWALTVVSDRAPFGGRATLTRACFQMALRPDDRIRAAWATGINASGVLR